MNKKPIVILVVCLLMLPALRGGFILYFLNSATATLYKHDDNSGYERLPMPEFISGYSYSDHFSETGVNRPNFGQYPTMTDSNFNDRKPPTLEDVANETRDHLPKNYADFSSKLPNLILDVLNKADISKPEFKLPAYDALVPNYKEYRSTCRFWGDIARVMFVEGKENSAFALSAGILLLAHTIDRELEVGTLLITRMIGLALRNIGNSLLVELANRTNLPANRIKAWIPKFQKLRQGILPLSDVYKTESKFYEIAGKYLISKGDYAGKVLLNNTKAFEELNKNTINKLIDAEKVTYAEKIKIYQEVYEYVEGLHEKIKLSIPLFFKTGISPTETIASFWGVMFTQNFAKAYEIEAKALQLADGAIVALAIRGYIAEKKVFPDSMQDIEDWLGEKLPGDIFLDMAPLQFNSSGPKFLFSVGPDMIPNTKDDLIFMPFQQE